MTSADRGRTRFEHAHPILSVSNMVRAMCLHESLLCIRRHGSTRDVRRRLRGSHRACRRRSSTSHRSGGAAGQGEGLADYYPSEQELAAIGREMEGREEHIDESPLPTDAVVTVTLAGQCLEKHLKSPEDHHDRSMREALEIASWDCHLIGAKLHRALSSHDEADCGDPIETDPIQNDWNGSAKVAVISMDRSIAAWTTIAITTADPDATAIAHRLQALLLDVERTFPHARKFVRPGFDEPS